MTHKPADVNFLWCLFFDFFNNKNEFQIYNAFDLGLVRFFLYLHAACRFRVAKELKAIEEIT